VALHRLLEPVDRLGRTEQVELVLLGADRTLDAAQRVAPQQLVEALVGDEQLLAGVGEALAQGGGLGGHVVAAAGRHQRGVLGGPLGQAGERRHHALADQLQRPPHLQLLDVLGDVARGHAGVGVLVAGERRELLDARLDVVAGDPLAGLDRGEVDLVDHGPVIVDGRGRDLEPELALGLHHRDPQLPLEHDLSLGRPQFDHRRARVPRSEDVGERGLHPSSLASPVLWTAGVSEGPSPRGAPAASG
jgi:hypothetical protein